MEVRGIKGSGVAALAASIAIFAAAAPTAGAAGFSVTGPADGTSACTPSGSDFSCPTLRSAVAAANTTPGTNTITLPAGTFTLTLTGPSGGELKITNGNKLTVNGAGVGQTIIDGNGTSRIFELTGEGNTLSVSGVTLQHGHALMGASGGAIEDSGWGDQITIDKSTLTQNSVTGSGSGGAVDSLRNGAVTITDSTISGNTTQWGPGGGVAAENLTMSGSTVNGNSTAGGLGGGIFVYTPFCECGDPVHAAGSQVNVTANPSIVNSTIVGNSTGSDGGAGGGIMVSLIRYDDAPVHSAPTNLAKNVQLAGLVSLVHDTIVGNSAHWDGGNIADWSFGAVALQASIVGGGTKGSGTPNNCSMVPWAIDDGSNMFFDSLYNTLSTDNCFHPASLAPNDILAATLPNGPGLETDSSGKFLLADNGGPTQTIALLVPSSPAIDMETTLPVELAGIHGHAADVAQTFCADVIGLPVTTDQRGAQRPDVYGTNCDIGAFESGAAPLALTGSVAPNPGSVDKPLVYAFTVTNSGPSFATHSTFSATLPSGTTFNSATPSQGSCVATTATTVDCALGVIPDGTASVTISVTPHAAGSYAVTGTASDRESGASAPLTLSANVPINGTTTTVPSKIAPKPSTQVHACVSRRSFPIHVHHIRGLHIVSATVYVNGLAVRTVRGKHLTAPIDLRQLPKGTFTVTIVAHRANGHVVRGQRTYHTCTTKLAGHKHLYL